MSSSFQVFLNFGFFIIMLFIAGLYLVLVTRNLMRVLIGIELMMKGVTLLIVLAGYATGTVALTQSVVITLIVIEVVVMAVMVVVILSIYRRNGSMDSRGVRNMRG